LSQVDIDGMPLEARSIGSYNLVFTSFDVGTWTFLQPIYRCFGAFENATAEEYEAAAYKLVDNSVEPFAKQVVEKFTNGNNGKKDTCKTILKASREMASGNGSGYSASLFQVTSFDVDTAAEPSFQTSSFSFLADPYATPVMYTTQDVLLIATMLQRDLSVTVFATYLIAADLIGASVIPKATGELEGSLLGWGGGLPRFSIDFYDGYYRVATTAVPTYNMTTNVNGTYYGDMLTESKAHIYVLQDVGSQLAVLGEVEGLPEGNGIKSARFLGDIGYITTTDWSWPGETLLVIDFSTPASPTISAALNITDGTSDYTHLIQDGTFLISVGQSSYNATYLLKIGLYNVADASKPLALGAQTFTPFAVTDLWSYSDVSYDHHTFTYLSESHKLVIPAYAFAWNGADVSFDGFLVYDIDMATGVSFVGNVTHTPQNFTDYYCSSYGYLPSRSMVFDGDLVTFKGNSIVRTSDIVSLTTKEWELILSNC